MLVTRRPQNESGLQKGARGCPLTHVVWVWVP